MINVVTASFVATVDEEHDEETGNSWFVGRVHLGGEPIWQEEISYNSDANYVMEKFAYKLSELFQ